jgi:hypothetical protein
VAPRPYSIVLLWRSSIADNDLQLTFGADASGVTQGVGQASNAIAGFGPKIDTLRKSFSDLGEQLKQTLAGVQALAKGLQSTDAAAAQQKLTEANAKGLEERARDEQKAVAEQLSVSRAVLGAKVAAIQEAAAAGEIGANQESAQIQRLRDQALQDELDAANRSYQIQQGALAQRLTLYAKDTPAYQAVLEKEAALAEQYSDLITKLKADGLKQQDDARRADLVKLKQEWDGAVNPLVSSFTNGLMQMAEGTKNFAQVMRSMGQQILNDFLSKVVDPMIEKWLWKEGRQTAASLLGVAQRTTAEGVAVSAGQGSALAQTLVTLKQDAAKVFGGIFAALSSNPVTLPLAAPAAAAGAAAVMSFSVAEGGWGDVPLDNMPTLLHAQEMVLPARLANPMRSMMDDYASSRNATGGFGAESASGDHYHTHNWNVSALDGASLYRAITGNRSDFGRAMNEIVRGRQGKGFGA